MDCQIIGKYPIFLKKNVVPLEYNGILVENLKNHKINDGKRRGSGIEKIKHLQFGFFHLLIVNDHLVTILHKQTSQHNEDTPCATR